jgi:uncharacterized protein YbaP (TraB family)
MYRCFILLSILILLFNKLAYSNPPMDSVFWKASRGDNIIYLLGVTHIGFETQYPIKEKVLHALSESSLYVTESSSVYESEENIKKMLIDAYDAKSGRTLDTLLKDEQCRNIELQENFLEKLSAVHGNDLVKGLLKSSPRATVHLTYSQVTQIKESTHNKLKFAIPVELYLTNLAKKSNMKMNSLDPEFWESLDSLNTKEMCNLVIGLVNIRTSRFYTENNGGEKVENFLDFWMQGKSAEIEKLHFEWSDQYSPSYGRVHHRWFELRNRQMLNKILALHKNESSPVFVVIGAAHLAGKNGIISMLSNAGFNLMPQSMSDY